VQVRVRPPELAADHERYVLGGILLEGKPYFGLARESLTADDFADPSRRQVFSAMEAAMVQGNEPTVQHLVAILQERGVQLDVRRLLQLQQHWAPLNERAFRGAVAGVLEESRLRRMGDQLWHAADAASQPEFRLSDAARSLQGLTLTEPRRPRKMADVVDDALSSQAMRTLWCAMPRAEHWLKVGPGHLVVVGGETGQGKSQLLQQMTYAHARGEVDVYLATYEMPAEEITARQISRESGIELELLLSGNLADDEQERVEGAKRRIAQYAEHIEIDDTGPDIDELMMRIRLAQIRLPLLQLVGIDYLQLIPAPRDRRDLRDERPRLEYITSSLKRLAQEIGVPIVLLSQFSRPQQKGKPRKPTLDILRGSGRIEQDSNLVLLLWHEGSQSWLIKAKGRSSRGGREIPLVWHRGTQTFEDGTCRKTTRRRADVDGPPDDDDDDSVPVPTEADGAVVM